MLTRATLLTCLCAQLLAACAGAAATEELADVGVPNAPAAGSGARTLPPTAAGSWGASNALSGAAGALAAGRDAAPAGAAGDKAPVTAGAWRSVPATTAGVAGLAVAGGSANDAAGGPAVGGTPAAGSGGNPAAAGSGGTAAPASAAGAPAVPNPGRAISVWIAGDSTVANGNTPCPVGWGADFQSHFGADVKVENSAVGGRSVRTWMYNVQTTMDSSGECVLAKDASGQPTVQARWQRMLDGMKPGDYLLIQFGINDSSPTCDRHVGINAFKESFGVMARAAKQRGAQPVFLTPVSALACQGSQAQGTRGAFVTATLDAGKQFDVPVIDLHARSVALYNELGLCPIPGGGDVSASTGGKAGAFFCDDHTHFDRNGAQQIGELIVKALRDQQLGLAERLRQ